MAWVKRKCQTEDNDEEQEDLKETSEEKEEVPAKKRRIEFQDVTIYNFNRRQGYTCVPSQGGNTLGMEDSHDTIEVLTVDEHAAERWRESKDMGSTNGDSNDHHVIKTSETNPTDHEEDDDFTSILLPVDSKERRVLLRRSGVAEIDTKEKEECRELRVSRQTCGCDCQLYCLPDTCPCAKYNIKCQVDRPGFPCSCTAEGCLNKTGRLEFNPVKVRTHFVRTIMRTRLEAARYLQHNCSSYLPSGTLGYLAQMYSQHDAMASTSSLASSSSSSTSSHYSEMPHWIPGTGWSLENPWWAYSAGQTEASNEINEEKYENEVQNDSETSESEEEIYTDIIEEEEEAQEIEETIVTDDIRIIPSTGEEEVCAIIEDVLSSVINGHGNSKEESINDNDDDYPDEGISSDHSYYDDNSATQTDSESAKCEEDSSDRSESFEDEIVEDKSDTEDVDHSISKKPQSNLETPSEDLLERNPKLPLPLSLVVESIKA